MEQKEFDGSPEDSSYAHCCEMKVVDLPMSLLSSIAALACFPSSDIEAIYLLRATFGRDEWRALNGLRSSCRLLRDAARLAVWGLRNVEIALRDGDRKSRQMPLETGKALPLIVKLVDVHGPGLPVLVRARRKSINHISFHSSDSSGDVDDICNEACEAMALLNFNALEIVSLNRVGDAAARALLGSLTGNMKELSLSNYVAGRTSPLSKEAAMSIKNAAFKSCKVDALLLQIFESTNLSSLTLQYCNFEDRSVLKQLPRVVNLRRLEYYNDDWSSDDYILEKTVATGALKCLEQLAYLSDRYRRNQSEEAVMIKSMMMGARHGLRQIDLVLTYALDEALIGPITSVPLRSDCVVKMELCSRGDDEAIEQRDLPLYPSLVGIRNNLAELRLYDVAVTGLVQLSNFPKLRTIAIYDCVLKRNDVIEMARAANQLTSLRMEGCWCQHGTEPGGVSLSLMLSSTTGSYSVDLQQARKGYIAYGY